MNAGRRRRRPRGRRAIEVRAARSTSARRPSTPRRRSSAMPRRSRLPPRRRPLPRRRRPPLRRRRRLVLVAALGWPRRPLRRSLLRRLVRSFFGGAVSSSPASSSAPAATGRSPSSSSAVDLPRRSASSSIVGSSRSERLELDGSTFFSCALVRRGAVGRHRRSTRSRSSTARGPSRTLSVTCTCPSFLLDLAADHAGDLELLRHLARLPSASIETPSTFLAALVNAFSGDHLRGLLQRS